MDPDLDRPVLRSVRAALGHAAIVVAGLLAIVGSGGGGGFPDLSCLGESTGCPGDHGSYTPPPVPQAFIWPGRVTVQVGAPVVFSVQTNIDPASYRWCRQASADAPCTDIAGATGATYTLAHANLGDDGVRWRATVSGSIGIASASVDLAVSSMPGVTVRDGDFDLADWAVDTVATPSDNGPTVTLLRELSGGHPGASLTATYRFPVKPSALRGFYGARSALYDPAAQGAIYRLDFAMDCRRGTGSDLLAYVAPMIEQAGRRYVATQAAVYCGSTDWTTWAFASLEAADFRRLDGPDCGAGESCPDVSALGAPIRLGFSAGAALDSGLVPPVQTSHGIDNWAVTVWRR